MSPILKATLAFELVHIWLICREFALITLSLSYARQIEAFKVEIEDTRALITSRFAPRLTKLSQEFENAKTDELRDKARKARWEMYRDYTGRMLSAIGAPSDKVRQLNVAWLDMQWASNAVAWVEPISVPPAETESKTSLLGTVEKLLHGFGEPSAVDPIELLIEGVVKIIHSFNEPEPVVRVGNTPVFKDFGRDSIRFYATYRDGGYSVMFPIDLAEKDIRARISNHFQVYRAAAEQKKKQEAALEVQHVS